MKPVDATVKPLKNSSGRHSALARWLVSDANPLTARVMANRIWQHHFGRGIVPSASDFGVHGEPPTHLELLDWLARELVDSKWDIKRLHRLILLSASYQQASAATAESLHNDPDNRLFSRMNRTRLEGEIIRDNLLASSGRLNRRIGGASVSPPIPAEAIQGAKSWSVSPNKQDHQRRSIYIFARRNLKYPFLETFDLPDSSLSCPKRDRSTTAPQALALLNAEEVIEASKAIAEQLTEASPSESIRIQRAYRLVLGRSPSPSESAVAERFLARSPLHELCRALFNTNEFIYID